MVGTQVSKDEMEKIYEAIELAKTTGKIKKGTNEVTKIIERGQAKLVAIASDVSPAEIVMHLPMLCEEKGVPCFQMGTKEELGATAGIDVKTTTVVIVDAGEAKSILSQLGASVKKEEPKAKETKEETPAKKEEKPTEKAKEE